MDPALEQLAHAYGVATSYEDWARRPVDVGEETVRAVLAGLGIDVSDPQAALNAWTAARWQQVLPEAVVVRRSTRGQSVPVRTAADAELTAEIRLEGGADPVRLTAGEVVERDGAGRTAREIELPVGLPLGDHRLVAYVGGTPAADVPLIVAPDQLPLPDERLWGWMAQLYAMRTSWGMGDYADLSELGTWAAGQGAGMLLVNPLHASALVPPLQNSPYFPASRRFSSPLYIRPEITPEYAAAPAEVRARVDALAASLPLGGQIDRDAVWGAKSQALEALFAHRVERSAEDSAALTAYAIWSALVEVHGPDWRQWPQELRDPNGPAVAQAERELAERVSFHRWLQHLCAEQLAAAQQAALEAGMPVGVVHDLAVGVDPGGADAWALQAELATGFSVGAPPDSFNQQGQNWGLPPWRPDRLAATGYAPVREMVRAVLRIGGGLRVDHILGLFRLWWVPQGESAAQGTYVSYDADAMLGVIALEAERAGALVVGEDLGTVPPAVHAALERNAVLGSTVLWFERDADGALVPPQDWRSAAVASVTTHDLPTAAGFLTGEHVRVRAGLGLLNDAAAEERGAAAEREEMAELIRREGVDAAVRERLAGQQARPLEPAILELHELLVRSPSRVVLASLPDAVGDLRQPNMPGTVDEYPNWRLPVADGQGRILTREQLCADPGTARLAAVLRDGLARAAAQSAGKECSDS